MMLSNMFLTRYHTIGWCMVVVVLWGILGPCGDGMGPNQFQMYLSNETDEPVVVAVYESHSMLTDKPVWHLLDVKARDQLAVNAGMSADIERNKDRYRWNFFTMTKRDFDTYTSAELFERNLVTRLIYTYRQLEDRDFMVVCAGDICDGRWNPVDGEAMPVFPTGAGMPDHADGDKDTYIKTEQQYNNSTEI